MIIINAGVKVIIAYFMPIGTRRSFLLVAELHTILTMQIMFIPPCAPCLMLFILNKFIYSVALL